MECFSTFTSSPRKTLKLRTSVETFNTTSFKKSHQFRDFSILKLTFDHNYRLDFFVLNFLPIVFSFYQSRKYEFQNTFHCIGIGLLRKKYVEIGFQFRFLLFLKSCFYISNDSLSTIRFSNEKFLSAKFAFLKMVRLCSENQIFHRPTLSKSANSECF